MRKDGKNRGYKEPIYYPWKSGEIGPYRPGYSVVLCKKQLIRPVFIGENGYKYFLPEQVQTVNFIRFFRKLDFSLESIATMLDHEKERPVSSELLFEYHKNVSAKR